MKNTVARRKMQLIKVAKKAGVKFTATTAKKVAVKVVAKPAVKKAPAKKPAAKKAAK